MTRGGGGGQKEETAVDYQEMSLTTRETTRETGESGVCVFALVIRHIFALPTRSLISQGVCEREGNTVRTSASLYFHYSADLRV